MKVTEKELYNYLIKKGVSHNHAIGMINNIKSESNFNIGAEGDAMISDPTGKLKNKEKLVFQGKDKSWYYSKYHPTKARKKVPANLLSGIETKSGGLFQHYDDRFAAMKKSAGSDWKTDWKGQVDYALKEEDTKKYLETNFSTPEKASTWFTVNWERPQNAVDTAKTRLANIPKVVKNIGSNVAVSNIKKEDIDVSHKVQLAVGTEGGAVGGLSNAEQNRLEELNIPLNIRAEGNNVFYEVEAKDLEDANELTQSLRFNGFANAFIVHTQTKDDGSTARISSADLYEKTGQVSLGYQVPTTVDDKSEPKDQDLTSFYNDLDLYKKMKTSTYDLKEEEIKTLKSDIFDYTQSFINDGIKRDDDVAMKEWVEGLSKKLGIDKLDKTNPEEMVKARAILNFAINHVKGEEYAEKLTGETGLIDSRLEDVFEDGNFREDILLPLVDVPKNNDVNKSLKNKLIDNPYSKYFKRETFSKDLGPQISYNFEDNSALTKMLLENDPSTHKEFVTTGNIKTEEPKEEVEEPTYTGPGSAPEGFADLKANVYHDAEGNIWQKGSEGNWRVRYNKSLPETGIPQQNEFGEYIDGPLEYSYDDEWTEVSEENAPHEPSLNLFTGDVNKLFKESAISDTEEPGEEKTKLQHLGDAGKALFQGAGKVLDYVGGVGGIVSYVMGKKGLKEAMKEVKPHASAQLSPMFMQHLRQSREIAKKGFHPDQARLIQKEMDGAYQKGLENAVRGSGGQRARFLASSGILDAQRSSALLQYAAQDAELQSKNQEKYEKLMMFKENFDIQQTEKERAEDMERQVANKKAAATFTSAAFTNLMSGFGGSSSLLNRQNTSNLYNTIEGFMKNTGETGTDNN